MNNDTKQHWETVYETKNAEQVSWSQDVPQTSLDFIHSFDLMKSAKNIDIDSDDSKLVDYLHDEDFENITGLDVTAKARDKAKQRLGKRADKVTWIVSDITYFKPDTS